MGNAMTLSETRISKTPARRPERDLFDGTGLSAELNIPDNHLFDIDGLDAAMGAPYPHSFYRAYGKRWVDVILASALLLFLLPAVILLMAAISTDGGRPIYAQRRVGRDGVPFRCYKLRSMALDSEARLRDLLAQDPAAAAEWAATQKLSCDPRITPLGKVLRRTSLDEIPQLWNVIRGDMSLIGPRPVVPDELRRYGPDKGAYLQLRPGLSGPWQVSGRNALSYHDRVRLDVRYANSVGLWTDLGLLARTVRAVLWATGR